MVICGINRDPSDSRCWNVVDTTTEDDCRNSPPPPPALSVVVKVEQLEDERLEEDSTEPTKSLGEQSGLVQQLPPVNCLHKAS